jgi:hypothetical protein
MADFLREHQSVGTSAADALVRLAMAMRHDTAKSNTTINASDLRILLLGSEE